MTQDQIETIETGHAVELATAPIAGAVLSETVTDAEPTVDELMAAREELDRRIKVATKLQRPADLAACRKLVALHGFGARELGIVEPVGVVEAIPSTAAARADGERRTIPAKYRNPETGDTWTGRGLRPKWVEAALAEGKSLDDLLISSEPDA